VPYWKIKNNWGTAWGDGGYWKIYRDRDCGLRTSVAYVI
jgi:C1A family cysteine protease